jgi:oxygen-independent coproporphyrinogen-3 oxidase
MNEKPWARYAEERLPRYTSYPTAPHFTPAVSSRIYREWLAALPRATPVSLYLHIPFCRSMCWYCGCHTVITRRDGPIVDYLAALRREIETVADLLGAPLPVQNLHFGGGTPTIIAPEALRGLVDLLRQRFRLAPAGEIAVEIDPRTLTPAMTATLGEVGVTRASLGVQSFDPQVQRAINRIQTVEQTAAAMAALRAAGVQGLNVDLIYGLPGQTAQSCIETTKLCIELRPDRFSVFGYAHVPAFKKHQRKIAETSLPQGAARFDQAEAIAGTLVAAGYARIGFDHYALPGDAMERAQASGSLHRNFQGYTTDSCETLIGFGASAIGRLPQGYVQNEVILGRYAEQVLRGEFATAKGYPLTADDLLRAELIERLMCDLEVDIGRICAQRSASSDVLAQSMPRLQALAAEGIVHLDGAKVRLAGDARPLVRIVASAFDAYLASSSRVHSRAV